MMKDALTKANPKYARRISLSLATPVPKALFEDAQVYLKAVWGCQLTLPAPVWFATLTFGVQSSEFSVWSLGFGVWGFLLR